jgi:hypothetical protein
MLRVLTYVIEEPLFYAATEVDISQATLIQIELFDDKDNLLRHDDIDEEGAISSTEISKYSEDGKLLCCELFMGGSKEVFRKRVVEYTEKRELKKEAVFFEGQLTNEQLHFYDEDDRLSKVIVRKEGQLESVTIYEWHKVFPSCCIREEIFTGKELDEIITREWNLVNGEPFLVEEYSSQPGKPEALRVMRFYNGKEMENGVALEIYNDQGNFMEEVREHYDFKGRIGSVSKHTDDLPGSFPYQEDLYEYDEQDRIILHQTNYQGRVLQITKSLYNTENRLVRQLSKSNGVTQVFFYVYEKVSGNSPA